MPLIAPVANALWTASNLPAYWRYRQALENPQKAQSSKLQNLLRANADTAFGKFHSFAGIHDYRDFRRQIPLSTYDDLEPWINRIREGEQEVLTHDTVTHLIPTSGSTGARKLIPFTAGLQQEFNGAIGPWLVDLTRQFPNLIGGRAYWSITPALGERRSEKSAVPIGFEADTSYLGGARRKLAAAVMAVPDALGSVSSIEEFRNQTLLHLLRCRDLRLISVWHPSFLTLLLDHLRNNWNECVKQSGRCGGLRAADPDRPGTIWPNLRVISCWGDGAGSLALQNMRAQFPGVHIQPKGLVATEGFVTLPFGGKHPLAVESHFFEFIDSDGNVGAADSVREGSEYQVVLTTAGGLWRYRLGDRVVVEGFVGRTPSLRFLGRLGNVSDRFGEKLTEEFVMVLLQNIFSGDTPSFALLAPDEDDEGCRYILYVEGSARPAWLESLDFGLSRNPHYAYCRQLGQLLSPRIFLIRDGGFETYLRFRTTNGGRMGDVKPSVLSWQPGWSSIFRGNYLREPEAVGD